MRWRELRGGPCDMGRPEAQLVSSTRDNDRHKWVNNLKLMVLRTGIDFSRRALHVLKPLTSLISNVPGSPTPRLTISLINRPAVA